MKTMLLLALLLLPLLVAASEDNRPASMDIGNGGMLWTFPDGRQLVVVPPDGNSRKMIDIACQKKTCFANYVGEIWEIQRADQK